MPTVMKEFLKFLHDRSRMIICTWCYVGIRMKNVRRIVNLTLSSLKRYILKAYAAPGHNNFIPGDSLYTLDQEHSDPDRRYYPLSQDHSQPGHDHYPQGHKLHVLGHNHHPKGQHGYDPS